MNGRNRSRRGVAFVLLAGLLLVGELSLHASECTLKVPDYSGWQLEEEATTFRPGTDLQFYAVELKAYTNPEDPADKVVELRRDDVLYILYYYTFAKDKARWEIYMDAGFADAPCGFFDPTGKPTGRYVRIDLACLRDTERVDLRSSQ